MSPFIERGDPAKKFESVDPAILEYMFDESGPGSRAEVIAYFDELFERHYPSKTSESGALLDEIGVFARVENRAAAAQLVAIGELFRYRLSRCSETEDWAIDTMEAVAAEVAAGLRIGQGLAASRVTYARAMGERLPRWPRCSRPGISTTGCFRPSCIAPI